LRHDVRSIAREASVAPATTFKTVMWEAGPHRTNSHEHVYRRISLAPSGQKLSQQNQQLNFVGGCNVIKSRDLEIGVVFDPHRPYQHSD